MEDTATALPKDVQAALDDVRRIRELVDRTRDHHPVRLVVGPVVTLLGLLGPVVAAYGVVSQLVLDGRIAPPAGLSRAAFLWVLGGITVVGTGALKALVTALTTRKEGYELSRILKQIYGPTWARVFLPTMALAVAASVAAAQLGAPWLIVGLVTGALGAVLVALPIALPLPELTLLGVGLLVSGIASMFVARDAPFYALAVIWGVHLLAAGLVGRRRFAKTA